MLLVIINLAGMPEVDENTSNEQVININLELEDKKFTPQKSKEKKGSSAFWWIVIITIAVLYFVFK